MKSTPRVTRPGWRVGDRRAEPLERERAIGESGQLVVQREVAQLLLLCQPLRDIGDHREPRRAAVEGEVVGRDVDADDLALLVDVAPRARRVQRSIAEALHGDELHIGVRPLPVRATGQDVEEAHHQELLAGVAVVIDGGVVHGEEGHADPLPDHIGCGLCSNITR